MTLTAISLTGIPELVPGDDLAGALLQAVGRTRETDLSDGDVIALAHKVVSKTEGAVRHLDAVRVTERAVGLAADLQKDPRHVQVILDESAQVIRAERGVLICETHHGFICANAGVDASNTQPGTLITLPRNPDASARALRAAIRSATGKRVAVVISDSFGRAWRHGQLDVAIGLAGLVPLDDWRGRLDGNQRELRATWLATADAVTAAADLVRAKDGRQPAVLVRGLAHLTTAEDGPGAAHLLRGAGEDLFR